MKKQRGSGEFTQKQRNDICFGFGRPLLTLLVFGIILFGVSGTQAADPIVVRWFSFSRLVIPTDESASTKFLVKIDGNPSSVQLALAAGGNVSLTNDGSGIWSVPLSHSQALFDYQSDDANHNFVGFLDVFDGATRVFRGNTFVSVKDESIPSVNVFNRGTDIRLSRHVVNIWRPDLQPIGTAGGFGAQLQSITREFYQNFGDDYDFIGVVTALPSFFENRYHFASKNEVLGVGLRLFNNDSVYGSFGKLQGITVYPIAGFFDMAETGSIHELGHQWINFSAHPLLRTGSPHWPVSTLARGIMGFSIPGSGAGGTFPFTISQRPDGNYVFQSAAPMNEYNELELYLAGMLPADQVMPNLVPELQLQQVCDGCLVQGPVRTVTIDDVIAADGKRSPDAATSQKEFRVANIVVTRERPLTDDEMALLDYFSARGEATIPLTYSSGFAKGTTKPFKLATRGVGTLTTSLVADFPPPALSSVAIFRKAKQVDHLSTGAKAKKFHLELTGEGFEAGATVLLNGSEAETTFVSLTQLSSKLLGRRIPEPGTMTIQVRNTDASLSNTLIVRIEAD